MREGRAGTAFMSWHDSWTRRKSDKWLQLQSSPAWKLLGNHSVLSCSHQPFNRFRHILQKTQTIPPWLRWRLDFHLSFEGIWAVLHHGLPARMWADPIWERTRLILSVLLLYRQTELPLCAPAYRLNEAFYSPMHHRLKCTTRLQRPIKDKGCHIFALGSLIEALKNCGLRHQKADCLVGWVWQNALDNHDTFTSVCQVRSISFLSCQRERQTWRSTCGTKPVQAQWQLFRLQGEAA